MDAWAPGVGEKRPTELEQELLEEDAELSAGGRGHAAVPGQSAAKARMRMLAGLANLEGEGPR